MRGLGSVCAHGERFRAHWTEDGKRRSKVFDTREEAERHLARRFLAGDSSRMRDITYSEYWETVVWPSCADLATRTRQEYVRVWGKELEPRIGPHSVSGTDWRYVQRTLDDVRAPGVQHTAYRLWRKVCNMAVRDGLLDRCPVDRSVKLKKIAKKKKELVTVETVGEWMEAISGSKYEALLLLTLGCGLRVEEACAVTAEDVSMVDVDGRTYAEVSITKALVSTAHGKEMKGTKNEFSTRSVILGEPFLSRFLDVMPEHGPLVPNDDGEHTSPLAISRNYRRWMEFRGARYVTMKDLRSSYATMQGEAGSIDSLVSLAMGHADGTTKGGHYQASTRRALAMIAENLRDSISSAQLPARG